MNDWNFLLYTLLFILISRILVEVSIYTQSKPLNFIGNSSLIISLIISAIFVNPLAPITQYLILRYIFNPTLGIAAELIARKIQPEECAKYDSIALAMGEKHGREIRQRLIEQKLFAKKYMPSLELTIGDTLSKDAVKIDLYSENIHTILVSGQTNTGKTTLLQSIYKQLKDQNSNQQIGFLVADITMIDFLDWVNDPYLVEPVIYKSKEALNLLDFYISHPPVNKSLIIHIEECDLIYENQDLFEELWEKAANSRNIYIFFSTSRPSKNVVTNKLLKHSHLKIIFKTATENDSNRLIDNNHGFKLANHGDAILVLRGKERNIHLTTLN